MPDSWTRRGSIWIRESDSRALLTPQPPTSFLSDFDFSVNPYAGCPFACADCYVPALPSVKFRRELLPDGRPLKAASAWGTWLEVRGRSPEILAKALEQGHLDGTRL